MVFKRPVLRHRLLKYSAIKVPDKTFRAQQELERRNVIWLRYNFNRSLGRVFFFFKILLPVTQAMP